MAKNMNHEDFTREVKDIVAALLCEEFIEETARYVWRWLLGDNKRGSLIVNHTEEGAEKKFKKLFKSAPINIKRLLLYSYLTQNPKLNLLIRNRLDQTLFIYLGETIEIHSLTIGGLIRKSAHTGKNLKLRPIPAGSEDFEAYSCFEDEIMGIETQEE